MTPIRAAIDDWNMPHVDGMSGDFRGARDVSASAEFYDLIYFTIKDYAAEAAQIASLF